MTDQYINKKCTLCGGTSFSVYVRARSLYSDKLYDIVRCRTCNLVSTASPPDNILGVYINADNFVSYFTDKEEKDQAFFSAAINELLHYQKFREGMKLLDVGCGTGTFLRVAKSKGWDVMGIEPNKDAVKYALEKFGLNIIQGALNYDTFGLETFNLITIFQTLEHIPNPVETLLMSHRFLKRGGIIFIDVPNLNNIFFLFSKLFKIKDWARTLDPTAHLHYFTYSTLKKMICTANFVPVTLYAGFNKALIDIALHGRITGKLLSYPYRMACGLSHISRVGMSLRIIAQKR